MSQSTNRREIGKPVTPNTVDYSLKGKDIGKIVDASIWMDFVKIEEQTADRGDRSE